MQPFLREQSKTMKGEFFTTPLLLLERNMFNQAGFIAESQVRQDGGMTQ